MCINLAIILKYSLKSITLLAVKFGKKIGCPWIKMKPKDRQEIAALYTFRL
jgi:hypothetical protein